MSIKLDVQNEHYKKIEKSIKYIDENFKEQLNIDDIASHIGMSKYHFIRIFKEYAGVTPIQFLQSITLNYAKEHLKQSQSILDSSLEMGFASSSKLHNLFVNIIGVTPKEYKELGRDVDITYGYGKSPFGNTLLAFTKRGICHLSFIDENKDELFIKFDKLWINANKVQDDIKVQEYLNDIFLNKNKKIDILVKGTNFQINVWKALLNVPDNCITTYQKIANKVNKPKAVRAVATAIASNKIAYLIPCHRVFAKSGAVSGYAWGIERKKILHAYEVAQSIKE